MKKRYVPTNWENVNCMFCNSANSKLYERYGSDLQFTYVKCKDCGLVYQSPRPRYDEEFIEAAYGEYFVLSESYTYSKKNNEIWMKELKEILKYDKKQDSILDIGTSMGDFLNAAKEKYNYCEGVEISTKMAEFTEKALSIKVNNGYFEDIDFTRKFSCIHMSHVIEHIPTPKLWLDKAKSILEKDGILAMSVPNMFSLDRRFKLFLKRIKLVKGKWKDNTRTPDHLFEPTIKSTLIFLEANGFEVLSYYTYSRKDMDASTFFGRIYNRTLKQGSNLRFFCKVK